MQMVMEATGGQTSASMLRQDATQIGRKAGKRRLTEECPSVLGGKHGVDGERSVSIRHVYPNQKVRHTAKISHPKWHSRSKIIAYPARNTLDKQIRSPRPRLKLSRPRLKQSRQRQAVMS